MQEAAEKKNIKKHVFAGKNESIHVCIWSLACIIWLQLFRSSSGQNNVSKALFCVSLAVP